MDEISERTVLQNSSYCFLLLFLVLQFLVTVRYRVVAILRDDRTGPVDGVYDFAFETADGLTRYEAGSPSGPAGAVTQQGSWS